MFPRTFALKLFLTHLPLIPIQVDLLNKELGRRSLLGTASKKMRKPGLIEHLQADIHKEIEMDNDILRSEPAIGFVSTCELAALGNAASSEVL